jgi:polyhydroxybutyrate depolymerase
MGFDPIADRLDWIVVYPDGAQGRWEGPDEVAFISDLIDAASSAYRIDPARVYATGYSDGAIFAYRLAAALPGRLAAIAPVAGLLEGDVRPEAPLSILHIHALDDGGVPYAGDAAYGLLSAEASLGRWMGVCGASDPPLRFSPRPGIDARLWEGKGADLAILAYDSGGHGWLPLASDFIGDFFYNHPPRPMCLRVAGEVLPTVVAEYAPWP